MPAKCCKEFWARIPDDVPVFTLVGYDLLAPEVVNDWLESARRHGVNAEKVEKAKAHLDAMLEYQKANPDKCKIPD